MAEEAEDLGVDIVEEQVDDTQGAPEAFELGDDTLVKDPETGKAVPYKQYRENRYIPQSEYTKKTQSLAQERKQLQEQAREWAQQQQTAYQQELVKLQQQLATQQSPKQGPAKPDDVLRRAQQRGFATDEDLRDLLEVAMKPQGTDSQITQALQMLYNQVSTQQEQLQKLGNSSAANKVKALISSTQEQYPMLTEDMLLDIYHSYEGDDLTDVFPKLAEARSKEVLKAVQAYQKQERKRALSGNLPTSGGEATPTKPLKISRKDALDTKSWASSLWESMQTENT